MSKKGGDPFAGRDHTNTGMMSGMRGMLTVHIDAPGLDEMIEELQRFAAIGDTDAKRVRSGMTKTISLVMGRAEARVPFRTGKMKSTLFKKTKTWGEGNITGNVGSNGTQMGGGKAFLIPFTLEGGRHANQKGRMAITPRRWLYHSYKDVKDQIDGIWKSVLELIVKDLAKKRG